MDVQDRFEQNRPRLRAVAYRMLGSTAEADDAVQEAWLRLNRIGADGIDNLDAWLTTVVGRVCLDLLRSRGSRRETPWDDHDTPTTPGPEDATMLADSVGLALLVVLDTLTPAFLAASRDGEFEKLLSLLDPDVRLRIDAYGQKQLGIPAETRGAAGLARFFNGKARNAEAALVNGLLGFRVAPGGDTLLAITLTVREGQIVALEAITEPARLREIEILPL
ncbi:RNA polymerase subunit sigma-70 [Actinoplanes sp. TRM 88003]|uniref:RNA polymerase subunit sigma-70 n=1 Tax=Paractinoplanes aksuensis TaxID=2939490 RepID=A0ABT1E279_9ACTN|nr:sigma factor [Actinoplanes aksuensis]MCO8277250.1 RNA polymerase subunit sigma-70 [Actinoplanes aksuensis]